MGKVLHMIGGRVGKLSAKQEAFARAFVELGNASEAYRRTYVVRPTTKPESVWSEASSILADPKVTSRVKEMQEQARMRTMVSVERLTAELEDARSLAMEERSPAATGMEAMLAVRGVAAAPARAAPLGVRSVVQKPLTRTAEAP